MVIVPVRQSLGSKPLRTSVKDQPGLVDTNWETGSGSTYCQYWIGLLGIRERRGKPSTVTEPPRMRVRPGQARSNTQASTRRLLAITEATQPRHTELVGHLSGVQATRPVTPQKEFTPLRISLLSSATEESGKGCRQRGRYLS